MGYFHVNEGFISSPVSKYLGFSFFIGLPCIFKKQAKQLMILNDIQLYSLHSNIGRLHFSFLYFPFSKTKQHSFSLCLCKCVSRISIIVLSLLTAPRLNYLGEKNLHDQTVPLNLPRRFHCCRNNLLQYM